MVARAVVAMVAVCMIAWLGVMERDGRLQARADAAIHARDLARAESDLRGARLLNPNTAPDVTRAVLYRARGQRRRAIALLEDVVRREPDNLTAWSALHLSATGSDPSVSRRSLIALQRLDPVTWLRR
jgi:hypothetical protein